MQTEREAGGQLQRVFLVANLRTILKVINDRKGKAKFPVDPRSDGAGTRRGEGAFIVPCKVGRELFIEVNFAPFPRVRLSDRRTD